MIFSVNLTGHGGFVSGRLKVDILAIGRRVPRVFEYIALVRCVLKSCNGTVEILECIKANVLLLMRNVHHGM